MAQEQNWRIPTTALDYMLHRQKQTDLEQRRPNIRRASDLVGPGIGQYATRLDDFNDVLATYNGFFSAQPGADNAPTPTGVFVGITAVDSELGGIQIQTDLTTGIEYRRKFQRYPGDESVILWGAWSVPSDFVPVAVDTAFWPTTVPTGSTLTPLYAPGIEGIGDSAFTSTYNGSSGGGSTILINTPGVYTGSILVTGISTLVATVNVTVPFKGSTRTREVTSASLAGGVRVPFTAIHTTGPGTISVRVSHNNAASQTLTWREFQIARVGDAA